MKLLILLLLLCTVSFAQAPYERIVWRDYDPTAAQDYETYKEQWEQYRTKRRTYKRNRRWQRWFVTSAFMVVGSGVAYSESRIDRYQDGTRTRALMLGGLGGLLAAEFLTNKQGRRDKMYSLINLGISSGLVAATIHTELKD